MNKGIRNSTGGRSLELLCEHWGCLENGQEVFRYRLENSNGMSVSVVNYGAVIQAVFVPDRNGILKDVVLGYDTLEEYIQGRDYFGATVGRVANRIAGAEFELDGKRFSLTANEGKHTLHGGGGFHKKLWNGEIINDALILKYTSPDGEDGFPGNLQVEQMITLSEENVLRIDYHAVCDRTTLCNLTGHSYFNLSGVEGNIQKAAGHQLQIAANEYTPAGEDLIPTGEVLPVEGSDYDFLSARPAGTEPLDGNLVLSKAFRKWDVRVFEPSTGRSLSIRTSLPGLQLYNGCGISRQTGKGGVVYGPMSGLALEPQFYPDAIHHPKFPQPILRAGEEYRHFIEYRFSVV